MVLEIILIIISIVLSAFFSSSEAAFLSIQKTKIFHEDLQLLSMDIHECKYYLRITVKDKAGVLARLSKILGDNGISIHTVLQKDTDIKLNNAELVIMTHKAKEKIMMNAIDSIEKLNDVVKFNSLLRVEEY